VTQDRDASDQARPSTPLVRSRSTRSHLRQRGQVLVIFVSSLTVLLSICAVVIDISWYWANTLRVQRAADAAALAGVVDLPGDIASARSDAQAAAGQNGYPVTSGCNGSNLPSSTPGICIYPDPANDRQLNVAISAPVSTFFMRLVGIRSITASRTAKAQYELPVPMGTPIAYYGVYQLCSVSGTCTAQPDAVSGTLASQGFFGAIEGQGSNRGTGDAFAPYYDGKPTVNSQYNAKGYDYTVTVPGNFATIWVFDPTFCATATKTSGSGHAGAGDHWLSPNDPAAVSTYYQLWNTNNLPLKPTSWTKVADSGTLFANENQIDKSATYGSATLTSYADQGTPSTATDCKTGAIAATTVGGYWHNKWWPLATNVAAGTYYLRIMVTDPNNASGNLGQSFENMFSLEVTGGAASGVNPRVYGNGRMATYANIDTGTQTFYLAQISRAVAAGKTMEIDLFDPGDVGQRSWLQLLSPDGGLANNYATFDFSADANATAHTSGTGVTCLQTYGGATGATAPAGCSNYTTGGTFYQNSWVTILIKLPSTYGSTSLTPPGDPSPGWWKIKYTVGSANDTTTWMVSVRGNPVHLIVP
jgi:Flp pilus assembly protein TadG